MKLCEFTVRQMRDRAGISVRGSRTPSTGQQCVYIMLQTLAAVNKAGLDGIELTDFRVIHAIDHQLPDDDQIIAVHATAKYKLKPRPKEEKT